MTVKDLTVFDLVQASAEVLEGCTADQTVALALVLLAHDNRDRSVWGGDRAITYWDRLPDRIRTATYAGPTLAHWWERVTRLLGASHPTVEADRVELARVLACGRDAAVLAALRTQTETVCLWARVAYTTIRPTLTGGELS